jgi:hypothetical protein
MGAAEMAVAKAERIGEKLSAAEARFNIRDKAASIVYPLLMIKLGLAVQSNCLRSSTEAIASDRFSSD